MGVGVGVRVGVDAGVRAGVGAAYFDDINEVVSGTVFAEQHVSIVDAVKVQNVPAKLLVHLRQLHRRIETHTASFLQLQREREI